MRCWCRSVARSCGQMKAWGWLASPRLLLCRASDGLGRRFSMPSAPSGKNLDALTIDDLAPMDQVHGGHRRFRSHAKALPVFCYAFGLMFWLTWNRFVGSYSLFSATSRSYLSVP